MNTKSSDNESMITESEEEDSEIEFTDEGKNFTLNLSFKTIRVFIYFYEFLNIIQQK